MEFKSSVSKAKLVRDEANRKKIMHQLRPVETKPRVAKLVAVESIFAQIREKRRLQALDSVESYHQPEKKRRLQALESVESYHQPEKKRRLQVNESVKNKISILTTKKKLKTPLDLQVCVEDAKTNELEGRTVIDLTGDTTTGQRSGQHRASGPSLSEFSPRLKPSADLNVYPLPLYIIKMSLGKGLGMFATINIPKGTRILAEKPFLTFAKSPELSLSDRYAPNEVSEAFGRLPDSKRLKYMQLHCPKRTDCSVLVRTYEANCYEMGSGDCVCIDASRINHSCIPNAHYSWNDIIRRLTVHAVKDIREGEEITISYCSGFCNLKERRRKLKPYVFTCLCPACREDTDFGRLSRNRRQEMVDLRQKIADYQNDPGAARAKYFYFDERSAILKILRVIDEEGLVREKSMIYRDAVDWALRKGYREMALKYASKELEVDLCCTGKDSPSYQETKTFLQRISDGRDE